MKKNKMVWLVSLAGLIIFCGCTTGGSFLANNTTNVQLSEPNFKIIARDVEGKSEAEYLLGLSYSYGFLANTLAIVRIGGSEKLYDDAMKDLWKNYKEKYGETEGKRLALVNIRYDSDILNLLLYTRTKLFINADVVEFVE